MKGGLPCAKCSALMCLPPSMYGVSMSRNSASSFTADSDRISIDFINEMMNVVRNLKQVKEAQSDGAPARKQAPDLPLHPDRPKFVTLSAKTW